MIALHPWRFRVLAALLAVPVLLFAAACGGDDDDSGAAATNTPGASTGFQVVDAWARATTNDVTAVYFTVKNPGVADRLVSVTADVTTNAQLHEVITEGASSKMQEKEGGFEVPANGELVLKSGGYHVMLLDLTKPLNAGDEVHLELTFEHAGVIPVTAPVKDSEGGGMSMSGSSTAPAGH